MTEVHIIWCIAWMNGDAVCSDWFFSEGMARNEAEMSKHHVIVYPMALAFNPIKGPAIMRFVTQLVEDTAPAYFNKLGDMGNIIVTSPQGDPVLVN